MTAKAKNRTRWFQAAAAALFALIVGAQVFGTALVEPLVDARFERRDFIDPTSLFRAIESGDAVRLYDVRGAREFAVSHLRGAVRVDVESDIEPSQGLLVAYCSIGVRSGLFAERQRARNVRVLNLRGGIFAWARLGLPLEGATNGKAHVHPFDPLWGLLLPFHLHAYR